MQYRKILYKTNESYPDYTHEGYFHKWVQIHGSILALIETSDGTMMTSDLKFIKFPDAPHKQSDYSNLLLPR